jgi:predicted MFS family arabinose efflux permease
VKERRTGLAGQIIAVILYKLLLNTGRRFVYPFAPALSRGLEVPLTAVTSIIATGQMTSLLGLFSGPLADRLGYRMVMRVGLVMLTVGMLVCGLVPVYWPVFIGLVVASFGKTVFDPAIHAFIGKNVPLERRGRIVGLVETSWAGSTLIGIPAFALIIDHVGLRGSFFFLALLGAVGWFSISRIIPTDDQKKEESKRSQGLFVILGQLLKVRSAAGMLGFGFLISLANDSLFVVYGAWFEQEFLVSIVTLGFSTVAIGAAELLGESMTAFISDRLGLKKSIIIGVCLATLAYLLLPLIGHSLSLAMVGMFCVFLTFEFTVVSSIPLIVELMPQARATMMAGYFATSGVGRMIGVLIGATLWQVDGIVTVAWTASALTLLGLLSLCWGLYGWHPDQPQEKDGQ